MRLTQATDDEIEAVAELANRAYRGGTARQGWTHEADYLDGQRTDPETLRAELASLPEAVILMLREEADGGLIGSVWLEPEAAGAWGLGLLTVDPKAQDRGVGRYLLGQAEAFVAARGAIRVRITVVSIRETLIGWYERRGYVQTGERQPFPYDTEKFGIPLRDDLEFVVMEKLIG